MLYGNIIFIKKTGGDGSKFPVTEKNIKIGRSEECLIRIYNPQVAPQHCQLIIEENGQATLRNLSNQTILNGKPLGHKDVVLCHGDIFKLGERLARWEYLPTSKYYRQLLSPTGRLVAVVMPQQRPLDEEVTPRASASQVTVSKNTPLGKRRYSERVKGEKSSVVKMRKSSGSELICRSRGDCSKFLTGRHSFKTTKILLKDGKPKERKSISGMISSKTPKGKVGRKSRKSTLPLWNVDIASPPEKTSPADMKSLKKSYGESVKSLESVVKTPSQDVTESESFEKYLSVSKNKMKTPQKALIDSKSSEEVLESTSKGVVKTPLKTMIESPSNSGRKSSRSTLSKKSPRTLSLKSPLNFVMSTPKPKSPKFARLVYSESKISSISEKPSSLSRGRKRMTLVLEKVNFTPRKNSKINTSGVSDKILHAQANDSVTNTAPEAKKTSPRKSSKNTPVQKTIRKSKASIKKSSVKKASKSALKVQETPTKNTVIITPISGTEKRSRSSRIRISKNVTSPLDISLINLDNSTSSKDSCRSKSAKNTPSKKTPAKSIKKSQSHSPNFLSQNETLLSSLSSPIEKTFPDTNSVRSSKRKQKFSLKKISALEAVALTPQSTSPLKARISSPRGIGRKLSPSSSAERAAKKLKTSCPRKPDKNKKAALLVLGKANRKQLISQNLKVLLKQKIVKKALKQSSGVSGHKNESKKKIDRKSKQGLRKKTKIISKPKKSTKVYKSNEKDILPSKTSSDPSITSIPVENIALEGTPKGKKVLEESQPIGSKVLQTPSRFSSRDKLTEESPKSSSKQHKQSESCCDIKNKTISPPTGFEKNAENYLFNSFRRCSKRLSSKNDTGRPDFIELSPTALGLIPKNLEIFKTPKDYKRRSSSLATPKNFQTGGIIKSASTSKILNRKSVRFSPNDLSYNSAYSSPNSSEKTEFNFSSYNTSNITMDVFVSPLSEKSSVTKKINKSKAFVEEEISKSSNKNSKSPVESKLCVRKLLQSPQPKKSIDVSFNESVVSRRSKTPVVQLNSPEKVSQFSESFLSDFDGMQRLFETPKNSSSDAKNESFLSNFEGMQRLLETPKNSLSDAKNESFLSDLEGMQRLFETPKTQKSPKNNSTDVKGVSILLQNSKVVMSPKNELTNMKEVEVYLQKPKIQKSPKALTNVKGVKKLRTTKVQKSPKNDLTDIRGVKKLLRTPKVQKSPKNDLTDIRGVKKLLRTPKVQKSPKNDLTDIRGVKKLLRTPKMQKSPKNDLTDIRGVKKLLGTPKVQKSPKNDLTDVRGVKELLRTPKVQKSPKNDLTDVRGVKALLRTPKMQKSPKNDLTDIRGVKALLRTPKMQKSPKNDLTDVTGVKELLRTPKMHKYDSSGEMGLRKLFFNHQPTSDYNLSLTGVAELFNLSQSDVVPKQRKAKSASKSTLKVTEIRSLRSKKALENQDEKDERVKIVTRGKKLKREETEKKETKNSKLKAAGLKGRKIAKEKAEKTSKNKNASAVKKTSQKVTQTARKPGGKFQERTTVKSESDNVDIKNPRKRKASEAQASSPPKLRRKLRCVEKSNSDEAKETRKRTLLRSKSKSESGGKSAQKVLTDVKDKKTPRASSTVQMKKTIKTGGSKQTQKVQIKRSQRKSKNITESEEIVSPRKTRSVAMKTTTKKVSISKVKSTKTVSETTVMKNSSPAVKRSTRRKIK